MITKRRRATNYLKVFLVVAVFVLYFLMISYMLNIQNERVIAQLKQNNDDVREAITQASEGGRHTLTDGKVIFITLEDIIDPNDLSRAMEVYGDQHTDFREWLESWMETGEP